MSFSSMTPIEAPHFKMIRTIVRQRGFLINDNKIAWFGPDDDKVVTGIVVKPNTLELLPTFIPALEVEIQEFKAIVAAQNLAGTIRTLWVDKHKKVIQGKLNYMTNVLGKEHAEYKRLLAAFKEALRPPAEEFGTLSWRFFHYQA